MDKQTKISLKVLPIALGFAAGIAISQIIVNFMDCDKCMLWVFLLAATIAAGSFMIVVMSELGRRR